MESPDDSNKGAPRTTPAIHGNVRPWWMLLSLIVVLAIATMIYYCAPSQLAVVDESSELDRCVQHLVPTVGPVDSAVKDLAAATGYCAQHRYYGDWLGDWQVRRTSFALQQYNGKVMLAMVVALTLAGVVLAAVQLSTALKLASTSEKIEAGGALVLEQGKLSLSSSVTGLVILALSFAFFSIYAIYVYPLRPISIDPTPLMPPIPKQAPSAAPTEERDVTSLQVPPPIVYASGGFGPAEGRGLSPKKTRPAPTARHPRLLSAPSASASCISESGPS